MTLPPFNVARSSGALPGQVRRNLLYFACGLLFAMALAGCQRPETIDGSQFKQAEWETQLKAASLGEQEFTRLYAQAVAADLTNAKVRIVGQRHLKVNLADGGGLEVFLDNAWAEASGDPAHRPEICRRYMAALLATQTAAGGSNGLPDTNSVVAVVRGRLFLDQFSKFDGTTNALVSEPLAADIHVLYACDSEQGISYLTEGRRKALGLSLPALRQLALANFHRIMPSISIAGSGPVFMLKADGNYESSLLLADKLWGDQASVVQGELVAAVPSRDVLIFTGSASAEGIKQLRQTVANIHAGGSHLISETLLVRRNGKWEEWK